VIERIRKEVVDQFGLGTLYFTAPTFITREVREVGTVCHSVVRELHLHPRVKRGWLLWLGSSAQFSQCQQPVGSVGAKRPVGTKCQPA
jgi:hypothetical protein